VTELGICGGSDRIVAFGVGCGEPILSVAAFYRCAQCDVPMHRDCLRKHFSQDGPLTLTQQEWAQTEVAAARKARDEIVEVAKPVADWWEETGAIYGPHELPFADDVKDALDALAAAVERAQEAAGVG
jgi:hypothetical protein